jgi:hypothetical protein
MIASSTSLSFRWIELNFAFTRLSSDAESSSPTTEPSLSDRRRFLSANTLSRPENSFASAAKHQHRTILSDAMPRVAFLVSTTSRDCSTNFA